MISRQAKRCLKEAILRQYEESESEDELTTKPEAASFLAGIDLESSDDEVDELSPD